MSTILSVIIPTYNSELTLQETLESLAPQLNQYCECIVVDGASSDSTPQIVKKYPFVKFITEPDKGVYDAMNKGVRAASGEWLYFLGSDDALNNGIINWFLNLPLFEYDFIYGQVQNKNNRQIYAGEFSLEKMFEANICHQAIFIRKSILVREGLFNTEFRIAADWDLNLKVFSEPRSRIKYFDIVICVFNENGLSGNFLDHKFLKKRMRLLSRYLKKPVINKIYRSTYRAEYIFQAQNGNVFKAFFYAVLHICFHGDIFRTFYSLMAFTKERLKFIFQVKNEKTTYKLNF